MWSVRSEAYLRPFTVWMPRVSGAGAVKHSMPTHMYLLTCAYAGAVGCSGSCDRGRKPFVLALSEWPLTRGEPPGRS